MRVVLGLLVLTLAACAAPAGGGAGAPSSGSAPAGRAAELTVEIDRGDGSPVERYTLTCDPPGGSHPSPQEACDHLRTAADPFAPVPDDVACTEVYGGPQTARVSGTWQGRPVDLRLSRVDGCRIAQWDALGPLLPGPVGPEPVG